MKLTFVGGVRGVTGSCILLETDKHKMLIDCGMHQGEERDDGHLEDFNFLPSKIDAVVLTHAHYDHCGRLPMLTAQGFKGKIFCTPPTKALTRIILQDAQHVMEENNRRHGAPILFSLSDVEQVDQQISVMNYHTLFEPISGVQVMLHDVGHILGSSFVSVKIAAKHMKDGKARTFVFTGDVGNDDIPILPDTEVIDEANVIITESTYGDRDHSPSEFRTQKLKEVVHRVVGRGGTLVIPAFSIERTQELLYELDRLVDANEIPSVPIYLDSPLAIKATEIYEHFKNYLKFDRDIRVSPDKDFFSFPNLHITFSPDESRRINEDKKPKIIVAGAGMMTGGRVLHHLKRYIHDHKSAIAIIGYQAKGTLGRRIYEEQKVVRIHGREYQLNAEVYDIHAFSAHADRAKLRRWLQPKQGSAGEIYLVHGDPEVKDSFKHYLEEELESKIIIPKYWQSFEY